MNGIRRVGFEEPVRGTSLCRPDVPVGHGAAELGEFAIERHEGSALGSPGEVDDADAAAQSARRASEDGRRHVDVLQPDAALVGGITGLRRIAHMAQEHNLTFTPHTWTNGLGVVANAHLTAALADAPFLEYPFDPPEWDLGRRDFMLTEPLRTDRNGVIVLGDRPGFGVDLDEDVLARTRVG